MIFTKPSIALSATLLILFISSLNVKAQVAHPPEADNQRSKVCQWMGEVEVCVTYNSPDVTSPSGKSRRGEIWGNLVPYGWNQDRWLENDGEHTTPKPWRGGANENTTLTISHNILIHGKELAAGVYGMFFLPGEKQWQLILSKDSNKWGHYFYNENNDVLRVKLVPEKGEYREWLTYDFTTKKPDSTTLALLWEDLKIPIHISIPNIHKIYIEEIKKDLTSNKILSWYNWHEAAKYCLDNNVELELGLQWAEIAVSKEFIGNANFATLKTKADILHALNREQEADSVMQFAMKYAANVFELHNYGRELLEKKKLDEAFKVLKLNATKYPDYWVTQLGLAKAYGARGDFKMALKYAYAAKKIIPKKELEIRHMSLKVIIEQLEKKQIPDVYLWNSGCLQVY